MIFEKDECAELIRELTYTKSDEKNNKQPLHKIPLVEGANARTASGSYKSALNSYILFLKELFSGGYVDEKKMFYINRLLSTVGKTTFIQYYYYFKNSLNNKSFLRELFDRNEKWEGSSKQTKINTGIRIFNEKLEKQTLQLIISSCKLEEEVLLKATEIYYCEFEDEELLKYRFIRPEFIFGKEIVEKLFSNYEVIYQYNIDGYKVDWYVKDLNLVI